MENRLTFTRALSALAGFAATLIPVAAAAQLDAQSNHVPRYHLVQLSVDAQKTPIAQFSERTQAINSCRDASQLARELDADFRRNRFISATRLPDDLKTELRDLSVGKATQVFSDDGKTLRVIVLCSRA